MNCIIDVNVLNFTAASLYSDDTESLSEPQKKKKKENVKSM